MERPAKKATEGDGARDPMAMLDAYDFVLPESRIAQSPAAERDASRLLVLDRTSGRIREPETDHRVSDLARWLDAGDLLVVNSTRVRSARLVGRKASGGQAEALLLGPDAGEDSAAGSDRASAAHYRALLKCTGRVRRGLVLHFGRDVGRGAEGRDAELSASVTTIHDRGEVTLRFAADADPYAVGEAPLPPYIRRPSDDASAVATDLERYQTIYAREPGAVAAPTAGLHFSERLFADLRDAGIERAEVVLHVGAGTFRPLEAEAFRRGELHPEEFDLPEATVAAIETTRQAGGRVIAVGTTTARVLESQVDRDGRLRAGSGTTRLFIRPGGPPFRIVDALFTNFHLPRSSLLLLVGEFAGRRALLDAYAHAIERAFRFYSYGDAMLILDDQRAGAGAGKQTDGAA